MRKNSERLTVILVAVLFLISMLPAWAFADTVSLELSDNTIAPGEQVKASGQADPDTWVSVKILNDDQNIVFFDAVKSNADGSFKLTFKAPDDKGDYLVIAGYGSNVASKDLTVELDSSSNGGRKGGGTTVSPVTPVTPPAGQKLTDINGHWAYSSINKLVATGAINGYPDGSFKPNNTITRAEFATVLVKAYQLPAQVGKTFTDTANHWAKDYIAAAAANGVVNGYDTGAFGPEDPITREQMAVMVVKAAKLSAAAGEPQFADSGSISAWAKEAVVTAAQNGIIKGYPDNTFRPGGSATRAEAVTVIVNALNK